MFKTLRYTLGLNLLFVLCVGCSEYGDPIADSVKPVFQSGPDDSSSKESGSDPKPKNASSISSKLEIKEEPWLLFRGNQNSTGVATTKLPERLEVLWEYKVKNGAFEGSPVIVGGEQKTAYIGDADGKLFAFDLDSGAVKWEFQSEIGYLTAPAFRDGRIFIGDMDGKFYCIDESGNQVWQFVANSTIDSSANFFGESVLFGSRDTHLYSVNRHSGEKIWQLETDDEVRCGITVIDGKGFLAGCDGTLHIIDLEKGVEVGNVLIDSPTGVTPAAVGNRVFVGTEQSGIHAIDWEQAEPIWTFNNDEATISTRSSPAVAGDHVVFGARDRTVYSLHPVTGSENWRTELKANIDSSPVIVGERVFVGSTDGRLYELKLQTGEVVWQQQFNGGFIGSPAVAYERLVIATDRGVVYCLGEKPDPSGKNTK